MKRHLEKIQKATRSAQLAKYKLVEEKTPISFDKKIDEGKHDMAIPLRQVIGNYYRRINVEQISSGFQLANPVTFDIKNFML